MSRGPFALPPLETLVAFEAAARHLSFTRAADEIALTQSAVSRQVQSLEASIGAPLFRRLHRALVLTEAGVALRQATHEALTTLDAATRKLARRDQPRPVVVTSTAGFAGLWLIPRLQTFTAAHPDIDVRISTSYVLVDLERDGFDVAVRYQPVVAHPPGSVRLFDETVEPVCAPRLLRRGPPLATMADLAHHTLLRGEPDPADPTADWDLWLRAAGLAGLQPAATLQFSSYDQLVQAALAGQGVALGRRPLVDALLKARRLVAPFPGGVASARGYAMIVSKATASRPEVRAFADWLTAAARAPGSARRRGRAPA